MTDANVTKFPRRYFTKAERQRFERRSQAHDRRIAAIRVADKIIVARHLGLEVWQAKISPNPEPKPDERDWVGVIDMAFGFAVKPPPGVAVKFRSETIGKTTITIRPTYRILVGPLAQRMIDVAGEVAKTLWLEHLLVRRLHRSGDQRWREQLRCEADDDQWCEADESDDPGDVAWDGIEQDLAFLEAIREMPESDQDLLLWQPPDPERFLEQKARDEVVKILEGPILEGPGWQLLLAESRRLIVEAREL
jgi:hypothetical protein